MFFVFLRAGFYFFKGTFLLGFNGPKGVLWDLLFCFFGLGYFF